MKILVTGSLGQLGNELRRLLISGASEIGVIPAEYKGCDVDYIDIDELDITNESSVQAWFSEHKYDIIFNCAAYTNVDACENNEQVAEAVNATGPANLAKAAEKLGAVLVHVSTDYVFAGDKPGERVESDDISPVSAYGRTKLHGELAVANNCKKHHIVRTAWLYGYFGKNFVKTMLNLAKSRDEVTVVDDQYGNPTNANDLAYAMLKIALSDSYGVWHATNNGTCSWADFTAEFFSLAGAECKVNRCTSDEYLQMNPNSAKRPHFSSLKNAHMEGTFGDVMRPWKEAIASYISNLEVLGN